MTGLSPIDILVVDDNDGDVGLIREHLRAVEFALCLHVVADGEAALAYLRQDGDPARSPRPDLILLDLNLPGDEGLAVLQAIKSNAAWTAIPVIVLTSSTAEEDVTAAYQAYGNAFIRKPLNYEEFFRVIRAIGHFWFQTVRLPARPSPVK